MANSRYSYVREFERPDALLPSTYIVIRLDGKGFHRFTTAHGFEKPNDLRGISLMNDAAKRVMNGPELQRDVVLAFCESDEVSFLLRKSCKLYGRRSSKLVTLVVSLFTAAYVTLWPLHFDGRENPLSVDDLPVFDGRAVEYVTEQEVKDYFRWRQVDTHINNLYNTTFWALVNKGGCTQTKAHEELSGTVSADKNEMLFSRFDINYNTLPAVFRKGSILLWQCQNQGDDDEGHSLQKNGNQDAHGKTKEKNNKSRKAKQVVAILHEDLIAEAWWTDGNGKQVLL